MKNKVSRDRTEPSHENKELVDTTKALIEVYKSAFGDRWGEYFIETVVLDIGGR